MFSAATSSDETITATFSKEDFTCPISKQLFLDPVMISPCGHLFEDHMIDKWQEEHDSCPCCRTTIKGVFPAPPFFCNVFEDFLKKNASLQKERYFSLEAFSALLSDEETDKLRNSIALLKISDTLLNEASKEEGYEGSTAVTWLVSSETGLVCLLLDDELRAKITAEGLNASQPEGEDRGLSGVYWLVSMGVALLEMDPELRGKIQAEGINAIGQEGANKDLSAVYYLTKEEKGRQLLLADARLRGLLSKEALNKVVEAEGEEEGKSPADWLRDTVEGQALLKIDPALNEKLEEKKEKREIEEVKEVIPSVVVSSTLFAVLNEAPEMEEKDGSPRHRV